MAESEREELTIKAGEYVLGLLDAGEREQFEAMVRDDTDAARELAYWEQRLGAMGLALAPVQPPARVWTRIAAAIGVSARSDAVASPEPPSSGRRTAGAGLFWRGLAIAASVAAVVLAAMLYTGRSPFLQGRGERRPPAYASVIYDKPTGMSWLVTAERGSTELTVLAMSNYQVPKGKILRAWLIPENDKPIGLGQMPLQPGQRTMNVPAAAVKAMNRPMQLAITLEDQSDAHADAPHGKILWAVPVARRTG